MYQASFRSHVSRTRRRENGKQKSDFPTDIILRKVPLNLDARSCLQRLEFFTSLVSCRAESFCFLLFIRENSFWLRTVFCRGGINWGCLAMVNLESLLWRESLRALECCLRRSFPKRFRHQNEMSWKIEVFQGKSSSHWQYLWSSSVVCQLNELEYFQKHSLRH